MLFPAENLEKYINDTVGINKTFLVNCIHTLIDKS
jgi:hypothetical protein